MRKFVFISLLLLSNPVCAEDLNANQIHNELIGQTIAWWDLSGWMAGSLVLTPDGKATISVETPHHAADAGQWTLQGNQICTSWNSMREGNTKCYTVQGTKPGHYITSGGNEFEVLSIGV